MSEGGDGAQGAPEVPEQTPEPTREVEPQPAGDAHVAKAGDARPAGDAEGIGNAAGRGGDQPGRVTPRESGAPGDRVEAFIRRITSDHRPPVEADPVEMLARRFEAEAHQTGERGEASKDAGEGGHGARRAPEVQAQVAGRTREAETQRAQETVAQRDAAKPESDEPGEAVPASAALAPERDTALSARERYNRERIHQPTTADIIPFPFDSTEPVAGALQAWLESPDARLAGSDPRTRILVHGLASRPGSEGYNLRLSKERAERVAAALEARGFARSQVEVVAHGEGPARDATHSLMRLGEPTDRDKEDRRDDPAFRVVYIEVLPYTRNVEFEGDEIVGSRLTSERLTEINEGAEAVHRDTVDELGEMIRDLHPLPDNRFLQVEPLEAPMRPLELMIRGGLGIPWEIFVRNRQSLEVMKRRRPYHRAAAAGVAEALDPAHSSTLWNRDTAPESQIRVYERAKQMIDSLSEADKELLRIHLIATNLPRLGLSSVAPHNVPHAVLKEQRGPFYERAVFNEFTFDRRFRME